MAMPTGRLPFLNENVSTSTAMSCIDIDSFVGKSGKVPKVVHIGVVSIKIVNARSEKMTLETDNALTLKLKGPSSVGVPDSNPVEDRVSPGGSVPDTTE